MPERTPGMDGRGLQVSQVAESALRLHVTGGPWSQREVGVGNGRRLITEERDKASNIGGNSLGSCQIVHRKTRNKKDRNICASTEYLENLQFLEGIGWIHLVVIKKSQLLLRKS